MAGHAAWRMARVRARMRAHAARAWRPRRRAGARARTWEVVRLEQRVLQQHVAAALAHDILCGPGGAGRRAGSASAGWVLPAGAGVSRAKGRPCARAADAARPCSPGPGPSLPRRAARTWLDGREVEGRGLGRLDHRRRRRLRGAAQLPLQEGGCERGGAACVSGGGGAGLVLLASRPCSEMRTRRGPGRGGAARARARSSARRAARARRCPCAAPAAGRHRGPARDTARPRGDDCPGARAREAAAGDSARGALAREGAPRAPPARCGPPRPSAHLAGCGCLVSACLVAPGAWSWGAPYGFCGVWVLCGRYLVRLIDDRWSGWRGGRGETQHTPGTPRPSGGAAYGLHAPAIATALCSAISTGPRARRSSLCAATSLAPTARAPAPAAAGAPF
jgi:hypothetical protein